MRRPKVKLDNLIAFIAVAAKHDLETWTACARHFAYSAGWKKFEPLWDLVLRARRVAYMRPILERVLLGLQRHPEPQRVDLAPGSTPPISLKVLSP
jgi:hypothetical protein